MTSQNIVLPVLIKNIMYEWILFSVERWYVVSIKWHNVWTDWNVWPGFQQNDPLANFCYHVKHEQ